MRHFSSAVTGFCKRICHCSRASLSAKRDVERQRKAEFFNAIYAGCGPSRLFLIGFYRFNMPDHSQTFVAHFLGQVTSCVLVVCPRKVSRGSRTAGWAGCVALVRSAIIGLSEPPSRNRLNAVKISWDTLDDLFTSTKS